jgi:NADH-quinone oxidoreductase subunit N
MSLNQGITLLPLIILVAFAMGILLIDVFARDTKGTGTIGYIALSAMVFVFLSLFLFTGKGDKMAFGSMMRMDVYAVFFYLVFVVIGILTILASISYVKTTGIHSGEYYALILFSMVGMMLMASSTNLVMLFVSLEMMSIPIYILAGFLRNEERSIEAALKYFLLGAFASGFFLYGLALVYAATGSTSYQAIADYLARTQRMQLSTLMWIGLAFITVGFGFKIAAFPFHAWTPDVYEGSPTSVTAYMATGVKAAAFAALVRIFFSVFSGFQQDWTSLLWLIAVLTMTVGNFTALVQKNVKRMLAYSSIAHAGYLLVAVVAGNAMGRSSILFYLLAYAFMNIGAFTNLMVMARKNDPREDLDSFAGLGFQYPLTALAMSVFMFSMAGIPPTAGFIGKFYIFSAAVKSHDYWLAVIGVLNSAVSVYYYLRVVVYMYFKEPEGEIPAYHFSVPAVLSIVLAVWGVLQLGILPENILTIAQHSIRALM